MNPSYVPGSSSFEAAVVFANFKHLSQQHSTTTTSSITASTTAASQLSHVLRTRQTKTTQPSYHRNQQYSIIGLTNAAGTLVERYSYTAYGTLGIYAPSGTVRTTSTYANRYTYTGREYDPDLNLYHFRARWYDPATGGFISRDPLGYVDGMSLYRGYFGISDVDPSGLTLCCSQWTPRASVLGYAHDKVGRLECIFDRLVTIDVIYEQILAIAVTGGLSTLGDIAKIMQFPGVKRLLRRLSTVSALAFTFKFMADVAAAGEWCRTEVCTANLDKVKVVYERSIFNLDRYCVGTHYTRFECPAGTDEIERLPDGTLPTRNQPTLPDGHLPELPDAPPGTTFSWPKKPIIGTL